VHKPSLDSGVLLMRTREAATRISGTPRGGDMRDDTSQIESRHQLAAQASGTAESEDAADASNPGAAEVVAEPLVSGACA
jgi:hypothetical protein